MNILIVSQYFYPELFRINDIVKGLEELGHDVTILTGLPNYPEGHVYKGFKNPRTWVSTFGKSKVYRVPLISRGKKKGIRLAFNYLSFFIFASILGPFYLRKKKIDKIFVFGTSPITAVIPGIFLKYIKRASLVYWMLDLWPEALRATGIVKSSLLLGLFDKLIQFLYFFIDNILVTSKGFIPCILKQNYPKDKVFYWPQWAEDYYDVQKLDDSKKIKNPFPEGFNLTFGGNIGTSQDFESIVEAASILKDNPNAKNLNWIIIGDGLHRKWVEKEIERRKISNIYLLGKKAPEEMPYFYYYSDALLLTLRDEFLFSITVPGKLQSYLASGRPIIGGLNGEGKNIIDEANAGITNNASGPRLLADSVLKILSYDKKMLNNLGNNAYQCYLRDYQRSRLLNKLNGFLLTNHMGEN